jgi:hypothetical protein
MSRRFFYEFSGGNDTTNNSSSGRSNRSFTHRPSMDLMLGCLLPQACLLLQAGDVKKRVVGTTNDGRLGIQNNPTPSEDQVPWRGDKQEYLARLERSGQELERIFLGFWRYPWMFLSEHP